MKYVISFFLTLNAVAAPINVYYERDTFEPTMIRQILVNEYQIPADLIAGSEVSDCDVIKRKSKLDLCLKNNGDLLLVSVDREFVNESLKIFKAP